eukprot:gnl/TRDRNA2_/TRDRNA2_128790_c0_seq3.p1 gnl/TRDRNA2_/TRDRNA2_128790_c0~~gnl/TRDRNA2_/TRDRNA2_128790_c0_seq3.p1  ORF type:complete len:110 (+),score=14.74 gnl/TRDRNA2_/TRDRNA2_128790_c0_seq3:138-467(+)
MKLRLKHFQRKYMSATTWKEKIAIALSTLWWTNPEPPAVSAPAEEWIRPPSPFEDTTEFALDIASIRIPAPTPLVPYEDSDDDLPGPPEPRTRASWRKLAVLVWETLIR